MNKQNDNTGKPHGDVSYFFPHKGRKSDQELIDLIENAQKSLDVAIFNLTDKAILNAFLDARRHGVEVRFITDKMMLLNPRQRIYFNKLTQSGALVKKNSHPGFMHLKMTIADQDTVAVGSANYTKSAQIKNDEVFIVLKDKRAVDEFIGQFKKMWNNMEDYKYM